MCLAAAASDNLHVLLLVLVVFRLCFHPALFPASSVQSLNTMTLVCEIHCLADCTPTRSALYRHVYPRGEGNIPDGFSLHEVVVSGDMIGYPYEVELTPNEKIYVQITLTSVSSGVCSSIHVEVTPTCSKSYGQGHLLFHESPQGTVVERN